MASIPRPARRRLKTMKISTSMLSHQFVGMPPEDISRYISSLSSRPVGWNDLPRAVAREWFKVPVRLTEYHEPRGARYYALDHDHVGITNRWYYNRLGGELAHVFQENEGPGRGFHQEGGC